MTAEKRDRRSFRITTVVIAATLQLPTALLAAPSSKEPSAKQSQPAEEDIPEVVITGEAVPGAVIGDVPPENQLNPADIESYGVSTVNDLLDQIADQTQSEAGRDSSSGP